MDTTEAYKLFCRSREGVFAIDAVAYCVFENYNNGVGGYAERQKLRCHRPTIYEDLAECNSQEAFEGIIARYKLEGV